MNKYSFLYIFIHTKEKQMEYILKKDYNQIKTWKMQKEDGIDVYFKNAAGNSSNGWVMCYCGISCSEDNF